MTDKVLKEGDEDFDWEMKFLEQKCDCCNNYWSLKTPYGKEHILLCNDCASIYLGYTKGVLKKKNGRIIRKRGSV